VSSAWNSWHALKKELAWDVNFKIAIYTQTEYCHLPIFADPSILAINSSRGTAELEGDYFGIREIKNKYL
jgi:hypothetical protein